MKNLFLKVLICSICVIGTAITDLESTEAQQLAASLDDRTYVCTVNPNADLNKGKCRAEAGGNSMCYSFGSGTACHGTLRY